LICMTGTGRASLFYGPGKPNVLGIADREERCAMPSRQATRVLRTRCRNRAISVISGIEMLCPMPG